MSVCLTSVYSLEQVLQEISVYSVNIMVTLALLVVKSQFDSKMVEIKITTFDVLLFYNTTVYHVV